MSTRAVSMQGHKITVRGWHRHEPNNWDIVCLGEDLAEMVICALNVTSEVDIIEPYQVVYAAPELDEDIVERYAFAAYNMYGAFVREQHLMLLEEGDR